MQSLSLYEKTISLGHHHLKPQQVYPLDAKEYELVEEIGCGVTAKVWRAKCLPLDSTVAVKIVDLERLGDKMDVVVQESRILFSLRCQQVLPLRAAFLVQHCLWLVTAYASAGSLLSIMQYSHPRGFDEKTVAAIGKEVLEGLEYLHRHQVIHRDLKAANILVGEEGQLFLGDFGVAAGLEWRQGGGGGPRLQRRTTFAGSPAWMAPEVLAQSQGYSFPSDIYSFGMLLLELALGRVPTEGLPFQLMVMTKLREDGFGLQELEARGSASLEMLEVIRQCLQKDPERRPPASTLLKQRWFSHARSPAHLKTLKDLVSAIPSLEQRINHMPTVAEDFSSDEEGDDNDLSGHPFLTAGGHHHLLSHLRTAEAETSIRGFSPAEAELLLKRLLLPIPNEADDYYRSLPFPVAVNGLDPDGGAALPVLSPSLLRTCAGLAFVCSEFKGYASNREWQRGFIMVKVPFEDTHAWAGPCYFYRYSRKPFLSSRPASLHGKRGQHQSVVLIGNQFTRQSMVEELKQGNVIDVEVTGTAHAFCSWTAAQERLAAAPASQRIFIWLQSEEETREMDYDHWVADNDSNKLLFGKVVSAADILAGKLQPPESFNALIDDLTIIEDSGLEKSPSLRSVGSGVLSRSLHVSTSLRSVRSHHSEE